MIWTTVLYRLRSECHFSCMSATCLLGLRPQLIWPICLTKKWRNFKKLHRRNSLKLCLPIVWCHPCKPSNFQENWPVFSSVATSEAAMRYGQWPKSTKNANFDLWTMDVSPTSFLQIPKNMVFKNYFKHSAMKITKKLDNILNETRTKKIHIILPYFKYRPTFLWHGTRILIVVWCLLYPLFFKQCNTIKYFKRKMYLKMTYKVWYQLDII